MSSQTFTGRTRRRQTRWTVHLVDRVAQVLIAAGGIGTIVAVSLVCVFLVWVVLPLFLSARLGPETQSTAEWSAVESPRHLALDENQFMGWVLAADGSIISFRPDSGELLERRDFLRATPPTAVAFGHDGQQAAFGFADGTVRLGSVSVTSSFIEPEALPERLRNLREGERAVFEHGMLARTPAGQFRHQRIAEHLEPPIESEQPAAIRLIDYTIGTDGPMFAALTTDNRLRMHVVSQRENLLTGETTMDAVATDLPYTAPAGKSEPPDYLLFSGQGDNIFLAWKDGTLLRFDVRDVSAPRLAERIDLVPEPDRSLTTLVFLLGKTTLVAGDTQGRVQAWFTIASSENEGADGRHLIAAHTLAGPNSPVTCLCPSGSTRLLAVAYADRTVRVFYPTNERLVCQSQAAGTAPVGQLALAPRDDGLLALAGPDLAHWEFDAGFPEASFKSLFRPVWYEGYPGPDYIWQSSSGSEGVEPKLSLVPLVFGTLKATFYSMLFGVPLAMFAAIYTSEFLRPKSKARIKPAIEMMASLPSVVLGFLAGLVIAPLIEDLVAAAIVGLFTVPAAFLTGAYIWQLLPQHVSLYLSRWRLLFVSAMLPLGILAAMVLGPVVEQRLFAGDVRAWLDGQVGRGTGGWWLLTLPAVGLLVAWVITQRTNVRLRRHFTHLGRTGWALVDLGNFLTGSAVTMLLAWLLATTLTSIGLDPRGSLMTTDVDGVVATGVVGTYVQRNALIVGFVMGFAIIPIIYTIADDALSTVPDHLRSASLGAGATPWQTAVRIIVPTAMSGLFSAVMIGLGRAVGETMIVLMAAGNTPIMKWNVFNGFQTLSALIATEMPEAVRNSTHYRTLFFAALTLFALTFVVNTVAEIIRLRFRRRAYEL